MTSPLKRPIIIRGVVVAVVVAGAVALTVFNGREDAPTQPTPTAPEAPVVATAAAAPFAYKSDTPYAEVELKLPPAVKEQPDLHKSLYDAALRDLHAFSEGSQADRTEAGGDMGMGPYQKTITYDTSVETPHLFSLARSAYEFTGGAHGMTTYAGVLWDKSLKQQITGASLLRKGADLDAALCTAINAEKKRRDPAAEAVSLNGKTDDIWSCPRAADTAFVLAAGSVPGKAGGLTFLVGPYVVGPYSDGAYWVNVPQSAIRTLIDPAYSDEFAGDPTPLPVAE